MSHLLKCDIHHIGTKWRGSPQPKQPDFVSICFDMFHLIPSDTRQIVSLCIAVYHLILSGTRRNCPDMSHLAHCGSLWLTWHPPAWCFGCAEMLRCASLCFGSSTLVRFLKLVRYGSQWFGSFCCGSLICRVMSRFDDIVTV